MNVNRSIQLSNASPLTERTLDEAAPEPKSRTRSKVLKRRNPERPRPSVLVEGDVLAGLDGVLDQDVLEQSEVQPLRGSKAVLGARRLWQFLGLRSWRLA